MILLRYTPFFLLIFCLAASPMNGQLAADEKQVFLSNEATINTEALEYSPAFYEDGIVFISTRYASKKYKIKDRRINKNIMGIFLARRNEDGTLQEPGAFSEKIMTTVHEGPVTFDRTADFMFFTRNNFKNGRRQKAKDGIVKLQIYSAEKVGDDWSNVKELSFNDKETNACHPAISVDGNLLYFASDRPGGHGGMDVWVSRRLGDDWGEPINLGPQINTEGDDVFPFIHADGTLYFASTGHTGNGGLDLFMSQRKGDTWTRPTNLGKPFNTENDDFGFIIDRDKKNGYFSTNRNGGQGEDDIYSFYIASNLDALYDGSKVKTEHDMAVVVSDFETGEMIEAASVTYTSLDELSLAAALSNQTEQLTEQEDELVVRVPLTENSHSGQTDSWGKLPVTLLSGKHIFVIQHPEYRSRQLIVDTEDNMTEIFVSLEKGSDADLATTTNGATTRNTVYIPPGSRIAPDGSILGPDGELIAPPGATSSLPPGSTIATDGAIIGPDGTVIAPAGSSIAADGTISGSDGVAYINVDEKMQEDFPTTIREGTVIQLPNIYYNFNDATIRPDARIDLDALASLLQQHPDIEIELSSHTDSRGTTDSNQRLSQRRAENAVAYLINRGVASHRMTAVGYGESQLRNGCTDGVDCSEEEHQYNRRTEVKITRMSNAIEIKIVYENNPPSTIDTSGANTSSSRRSSSFGRGGLSVIAGVFANFNNAEKRVNKLLGMGYSEAEIVNLGNSDKYSVVVRRVSSESEGRALVSELKSRSIRSFLKG